MKTLQNCLQCKKKDSLEALHYYDKNGKWKTDPIAFLICKNCFQCYRFERLPFKNDIQFLSIQIGAEQDSKYFKEIESKKVFELKKSLITCLYCGNSEADFSYIHEDSEGISYKQTEKKPCVIKLHTKDRTKKSDRKQVGYLCGSCKTSYLDNEKMKFPINEKRPQLIKKLPPSHPRFSETEEKRLNQFYKDRNETNKKLKLGIVRGTGKPLPQKERKRLELKLDRLQEQIRNTNHVFLYSLSAYLT